MFGQKGADERLAANDDIGNGASNNSGCRPFVGGSYAEQRLTNESRTVAGGRTGNVAR